MRKITKFLAATVLTVSLGFAPAAQADSTVATILGGAGGAALGAQFGKGNGKLVTTAIGTLLGAGIGNSMGQSMERGDAAYYNQRRPVYTEQHVYREEWREPRHEKRRWHRHNKPQRQYADVRVNEYAYYEQEPQVQQDYCREYTNNVKVGGRTQSSYGTACLQPDGSWKIVSNQ